MDKKQILKIKKEFKKMKSALNERTRRLWAAEKAMQLGHGGNKILCEITGLSRKTIYNAKQELKHDADAASVAYIRKPGGGRRRNISDKELKDVVQNILKENSGFDKLQAFSYSTLGINKILKEFKTRKISVTSTRIVDILQNEILCAIYRQYKGAKRYPYVTRKQQFELIKSCTATFWQHNYPIVIINNWDSKDAVEHNEQNIATLKEWWEERRYEPYILKLSNVLILLHGASSPVAKNIFQEVADVSNLKLTVCHVPEGILRIPYLHILDKHTIGTISFQIITNGIPLYHLSWKEPKEINYKLPSEWYYTLKPTGKENKT